MKKYADGGIYKADMGQPPQDVDMGSAPKKRTDVKRPMPAPAAKRPAAKRPAGGGVFREGMPVPQDVDMGSVGRYAKGGSVGSASRRADGIANKGKTKCKMV